MRQRDQEGSDDVGGLTRGIPWMVGHFLGGAKTAKGVSAFPWVPQTWAMAGAFPSRPAAPWRGRAPHCGTRMYQFEAGSLSTRRAWGREPQDTEGIAPAGQLMAITDR